MAKWQIENNHPHSIAGDREYWEQLHLRRDSEPVCSIANDHSIRQRIIECLCPLSHAPDILLPGCGSNTLIQQEIIRSYPDARIVCVDYPAIVRSASQEFSHPGITYVSDDLLETNYVAYFDAVVVVNSIVSGNDAHNRRLVSVCRMALKDDGMFIGFFPTIFSPLDIALLANDDTRLQDMNLSKSTFFERSQNTHQIFYTPLRLRVILQEAQLVLDNFEVVFLTSEECFGQDKPWRHPGAEDEDLLIYEFLVLAHRAAMPLTAGSDDMSDTSFSSEGFDTHGTT